MDMATVYTPFSSRCTSRVLLCFIPPLLFVADTLFTNVPPCSSFLFISALPYSSPVILFFCLACTLHTVSPLKTPVSDSPPAPCGRLDAKHLGDLSSPSAFLYLGTFFPSSNRFLLIGLTPSVSLSLPQFLPRGQRLFLSWSV